MAENVLWVRRLLRHRSARVGLIIVVIMVLTALLAPWLAPAGYDQQQPAKRLSAPGEEYWLGTDHLGRSVLDRIIWGSRVSLAVGVISVGVGLIGGLVIGLASGYYGGHVDRILMGLMDVMLAIPGILLAILVVSILGPGLLNVMIAVGIDRIPAFARVVRASTLSLKQQEFIEAARAVGCGPLRIMCVHILPNVVAPVVVLATLGMGSAILTAAGLSFLGLGAQPPTPDWGAMVSDGRNYLRTAWWVTAFPGLAILLAVLGFNLLGDGLRDALDPRTRL